MSYCTQCGTAAAAEALFCRSCGQPLAAQPATVPSPTRQPSNPPVTVNPKTPNVIREGVHEYELAPLARRTVAFIIDLAIFIALDVAILLLDKATQRTDYYGKTHMNPAVAMLYLLWACAFFLYWWLVDGVLPQRATIGKRAMGMRVVRTDGRPFEGAGAFGRGLAHWLSVALLGLG